MKEKKAPSVQQGLDNLIEVYAGMWDEHATALILAHRYVFHDPGELAELVSKIQQMTDQVFRPLNSEGHLRAKTDLARNVIQAAIVLLDVSRTNPIASRCSGMA